MHSEVFHTRSEEEMIALGERLAKRLPARAAILLTGNLGAGKTTLTKGIVQGLGVASAEDVASPTFTLIHEYGDPARVYHIDLYRLDEPRQLATLGLDEIFDREAIVIVEWAEKFAPFMPEEHVAIRIGARGDERTVTIQASRPGFLAAPE